MCIRDSVHPIEHMLAQGARLTAIGDALTVVPEGDVHDQGCLLYTSDAADERSSVDLGGRRIIKKKKTDRTAARHSLSR